MAAPSAEREVRAKAAELWPNDRVAQAWFVGLAKQESGFNPSAHAEGVPKGGADGLFQFTYDLKKKYGLKPKDTVERQLAAAGDYLTELHAKHGGDWTKVIAEHHLGIPKYNKFVAGESNGAIENFTADHLPKVAKFAQRELGEFQETPPIPKTFKSRTIPEMSNKPRETLATQFKRYGADTALGLADLGAVAGGTARAAQGYPIWSSPEETFAEGARDTRAWLDNVLPFLKSLRDYKSEQDLLYGEQQNPDSMLETITPLVVNRFNVKPTIGSDKAGPFFHGLKKIRTPEHELGLEAFRLQHNVSPADIVRPRLPRANEDRSFHAGTPKAAYDRVNNQRNYPGTNRIHELYVPKEGLAGQLLAPFGDPGMDLPAEQVKLLRNSGFHSTLYRNDAEDPGSFSLEILNPSKARVVGTHEMPTTSPPSGNDMVRPARVGYTNWLEHLASDLKRGNVEESSAMRRMYQVQSRNPALIDPSEFELFGGLPPTEDSIKQIRTRKHKKLLGALLRGDYDKDKARLMGNAGINWDSIPPDALMETLDIK